MKKRRVLPRWLRRPQALIGIVIICLCVGGAGNIARPSYAKTPQPKASASVLALPSVRPSCAVMPCIAVTFDDGPHAVITPQVLDILARQQTKATFFIVGQRVAGQESLLRREHAEGHELGNHSWSHLNLSKLSSEEVQMQLQATQQAITAAGVPAPHLLRPPYGAVNDVVAAHNHLTVVRWNIDPEDWKEQDPGKISNDILAHARPGAIILLHDIYPGTVAALETVLSTLKQHYQLLTVSQLLNLSPGDQGQYFSR